MENKICTPGYSVHSFGFAWRHLADCCVKTRFEPQVMEMMEHHVILRRTKTKQKTEPVSYLLYNIQADVLIGPGEKSGTDLDPNAFIINALYLNTRSLHFPLHFTTGRYHFECSYFERPNEGSRNLERGISWSKCWVRTPVCPVQGRALISSYQSDKRLVGTFVRTLQYEMCCPFKFIQFSRNLALGWFFSTRFSLPLLH